MDISVKFHAYKVISDAPVALNQLLYSLNEKQQQERLRVINGFTTIMEELEVVNGGIHIASFCKHRALGPGRASSHTVTEPFDLAQNESFGELTSMLLTKDCQYVIVQYNHYGVKASAISSYLSNCLDKAFTGTGYEFDPILRGDVKGKLERADSLGWLEASFDFSRVGIPREFKENVTLRKLTEVMATLDDQRAAKIEFKVSKAKGEYKGIDIQNSTDLVNNILELSDMNIVKTARVNAIYSDRSTEFLDLLKAKEELMISYDLADEETMLQFPDLKRLILSAYLDWKNRKIISE